MAPERHLPRAALQALATLVHRDAEPPREAHPHLRGSGDHRLEPPCAVPRFLVDSGHGTPQLRRREALRPLLLPNRPPQLSPPRPSALGRWA